MTERAATLDWSVFDDPRRLELVKAIDEVIAANSDSLQRVTRLASVITSSQFSQISLIGGSQFVPAAHGLTYTAEQQHTPREHSLCSITMASGGTLVVDDAVTHTWVRDLPPVTSGVVGSYIGVPLVLPDGAALGALCAFDSCSRSWSPADRLALEDLAVLVTRELQLMASLHNAQSSEVMLRQIIADMVDRPGFNREGQLRAAARYRVPADAPAGGDWVDWSVIDERRTTFGIGDVAGHGLSAVVIMDDLRHTLRAFALEGSDPADILARGDAHLRRIAQGEIATAMKVNLDTRTGVAAVASAGHVSPLLLHRGSARWVGVRTGPPLGFGAAERPASQFELPEGARLVLMTDGLYERRGEPLDESLARVAHAVETMSATTVEEMADGLIALADRADAFDDACVLVVERPAARAAD